MENIALTESTYYILLSLYHPQHGYGIMQQTEQLSGGRVRLAARTCSPEARACPAAAAGCKRRKHPEGGMTMNTRKTIHKVYLAWDFKKEELWLNEMAAEG